MPDKKRSYQADISFTPILEPKPHPQQDDGDQSLAISFFDRHEYPFSREVIKRLIDRIKED